MYVTLVKNVYRCISRFFKGVSAALKKLILRTQLRRLLKHVTLGAHRLIGKLMANLGFEENYNAGINALKRLIAKASETSSRVTDTCFRMASHGIAIPLFLGKKIFDFTIKHEEIIRKKLLDWFNTLINKCIENPLYGLAVIGGILAIIPLSQFALATSKLYLVFNAALLLIPAVVNALAAIAPYVI